MNWHYRHDALMASETGQAFNLRGIVPQVMGMPALTTRLVGPEASAA
jgi:hypothetical protein